MPTHLVPGTIRGNVKLCNRPADVRRSRSKKTCDRHSVLLNNIFVVIRPSPVLFLLNSARYRKRFSLTLHYGNSKVARSTSHTLAHCDLYFTTPLSLWVRTMHIQPTYHFKATQTCRGAHPSRSHRLVSAGCPHCNVEPGFLVKKSSLPHQPFLV